MSAHPRKQKVPAARARNRQAVASLRARRLRVTRPRRAILELLTRAHGPFTIEEIRRRLRPAGLDRVTVYRSLAAFAKIGLVRRCDFGDNAARYEYGGDDAHHHHLVCRRCHRTVVLDRCAVAKLDQLVRAKGYRQVTHSLEFFGICPACQARRGRRR